MGYQKLIKSGDMVEFYSYEKDVLDTSALSVRGERVARLQTERRSDNLRAVSNSFRRLIQANLVDLPPYFVTLTFRDFVDIKDGYGKLHNFIKRCRRIFGLSFRYVVVPEYGTHGSKRLHFHILFWALPTYVENERWTRLLASIWTWGFVDFIVTDGSHKLASYMAKYLRKSSATSALFKQKSYVASRNIFRPVVFSSASRSDLWGTFHKGWNIDFVMDSIGISDFSLVLSKEFDTFFLGRCLYKLYSS